jgi:hypothetical protein
VPNLLLQLQQEWLQNHPDGNRRTYLTCPDCEQGLIHLRRDVGDGLSAVYLFRCRRCNQSDLSEAIPLAYRSDLLERGYSELGTCQPLSGK